MRITKQHWKFEASVDGQAILKQIERAGRTCYKSEDEALIPEMNTTEQFCKRLVRSGHHSVLEHATVSVRIVTDRGVTHEIVRHRIGVAYSQESTRFCNYSQAKFGNEIEVILPVWLPDSSQVMTDVWEDAMREAERTYFTMLDAGWAAQQARTVLPNSLKTELVMTCNIRAWRHFFTLRCSSKAHPQMRDLAVSVLVGFREAIPVLFDDINP